MIDKTFIIKKNVNTGENDREDLLFWIQKTAEERISAVEDLRREYWGEDYASEQRFPRFYKITKHSQR